MSFEKHKGHMRSHVEFYPIFHFQLERMSWYSEFSNCYILYYKKHNFKVSTELAHKCKSYWLNVFLGQALDYPVEGGGGILQFLFITPKHGRWW